MPTLLVHYDGYYYYYEGSKTSHEEFLHFMNKIINPVVELTTEEDLAQFLALENEYVEKTEFFEKSPLPLPAGLYQSRRAKTRVIAFIFDKEDFNDELNNL
jgi:hypothetical protein